LAICSSDRFKLGESATTLIPFLPRKSWERYKTRAESTPPEKAVRLPSDSPNQASILFKASVWAASFIGVGGYEGVVAIETLVQRADDLLDILRVVA